MQKKKAKLELEPETVQKIVKKLADYPHLLFQVMQKESNDIITEIGKQMSRKEGE